MQAGTSMMTDDDLTDGGWLELIGTDGSGNELYKATKSISIGESSGGSMLGLHVGVGMAGKFGFGKVKITPSVGYRMLGYKLSTANNNGLVVSSYDCWDEEGVWYCPSLIWFGNSSGGSAISSKDMYQDGWWGIPAGDTMVGTDSYSFHQDGNTHIYDVSWNGPYVAADLDYQINDNNFVVGRIELGLPGYHAVGDQPYRPDWEHPKSVEDEKGMFGALHLGLLASWTTMLTPSLGLSVGLTYDYYSVSGAKASTYNSESFYGPYYIGTIEQIYQYGLENNLWTDENTMYQNAADNEFDNVNLAAALEIAGMYESCGNSWVCVMENEVNSFYRSIGIRVGLTGKF
jgi:hypothetical protein